MDWNATNRARASRHGTTRAQSSRLFPLDALRGLIIVLMALDHSNHFVAQQHSSGEYWGGPFPAYQDILAFLTRFVTHVAAPGFFLLMGMGMALFAASRHTAGWGKAKISLHFVLRSLLLIALQILVVNRAWELSQGGWGLDVYIGVLCALGGTMMLGSLPTMLLAWLLGLLLLYLPSLWYGRFKLSRPAGLLWRFF